MEPTTAKCCGRRRRTALLLLILLLSMTATAAQHVVVAYVTSWSSGLPDPTRMTHINYAFGGVNSARTGVSISNASRLQQIVALKRRNPELKVLLSIGGWGAGGFTPMTSDATKRMAFARDCLRVCQQYGLDGIDLDWEFPGNNSSGESSPAGEKQNYSLLCRDLRQVLGADYLLTMASNYTPGNYDFRGCIQYLDFVNVMCYNMASPPNHHAALYKGGGPVNNGYYSCQMAMNDHINAGIPRQKLVMGMPLYGHESGRGEQSYQRARDLLATGNYVEDWDDRGKVPWIKKKSDGSFYMDFENQRSIEYKCRYILGQKFLGGMYWDYHSDDNQGTLRNTIYKLLLLGETDDPVVRLDGEQMLPDGFRRYSWDGSLTQGQTLRIELEQSDITLQPDEDFFAPQTDGSLRFLPIDGRYRIRADLDLRFLSVEALDADGQPATLQTDGSGAIWLIGSQGVGKPTFETAGRAWDAEEGPLCLAQPRAGSPCAWGASSRPATSTSSFSSNAAGAASSRPPAPIASISPARSLPWAQAPMGTTTATSTCAPARRCARATPIASPSAASPASAASSSESRTSPPPCSCPSPRPVPSSIPGTRSTASPSQRPSGQGYTLRMGGKWRGGKSLDHRTLLNTMHRRCRILRGSMPALDEDGGEHHQAHQQEA